MKEGIMKGKGGRELSEFQERLWMINILKKRKYENQAHGENSGVHKLIGGQVMIIRYPQKMPRKLAKHYAKRYGISEGYVYHLRSSNPRVRKWKHLDTEERMKEK